MEPTVFTDSSEHAWTEGLGLYVIVFIASMVALVLAALTS